MKWRGLAAGSQAPARATTSLREALEERKAAIRQYALPETQAIQARAVEELRLAGIAERILPIAAQAPPFELPNQEAQPVSSAELLAHGPLVLVFFRGRWCPFCVTQLEMLNQWLPEFRQPGATLVGMSPQTVHQSYLMHNQHRLGFPLLGDAQNAVARQFGLVYRVPDYLEELYRRSFVNLPFANGDPSWELPLAATYVVDRTGTVLFAFASADYTERAEPQDVARVVREAARN